MLAVGQLPAVQRVFLHGGDEEIAVGREGHAGMGSGPFEFGRLAVGRWKMQRGTIVAGDRDTHTLRSEGQPLDAARMDHFFELAVRQFHPCRLAAGKSNGTARAGRYARHPFATDFSDLLDRAVCANAEDLAVLAAAYKPLAIGIGRSGQQTVMRFHPLVAVVEPVDHAVGEREMRDAGKPAGGDTMAVEIKGCDCGHQAWQASKVRLRRSASSSRPMKTSRLSCCSSSFQARWWSPSRIMWTPCTT